MKCERCSIEFEGKFCPECGASAEESILPPLPKQEKPKKKRKPFFLRWWFILLAVISIGVAILVLSPEGEELVWSDMVLGDKLPEPDAKRCEINENSAEELWIDIKDISPKEFNDYVESCKTAGYTIDAESTSTTYNAYNDEGYNLDLYFYSTTEEMKIQLEKPMELTAISWPTSLAGKQLPAPKSLIGSFNYEYDDHFFVYVGNTPIADFNEYVVACSNKGFNIDFNKSEGYYLAENKEGWELCLRYEGFNIMSVEIDAPEETPPTNSTPSTPSVESNSESGLDPDFKAAMDSYEAFMDEYVAFMKKYKDNPSDLSLITDYAKFMTDYSKFVSDFEKWEDEDLNTQETAYYIEVQARVSKKLLEVAY